ncbi:MAG: hypothetical protein N2422_02650 [Rhodobacteraceae bacterium]|nr:hypothetical protein [Paracoccaceae bacterium]
METSGQRGAGEPAVVQQQGHVDPSRPQPAGGRPAAQRSQETPAAPAPQMGGSQITDWASI